MYLKVICAWCGEHIRTEKINIKGRGTIVSHGICKSCKAKVRKEIDDESKNDVSESQGASGTYGGQ